MPVTDALPVVAVIGCGGTIASMGSSSIDLIDYPEHGTKLDAATLVSRVPELAAVARLLAVDFRAIGSTDLTVEDWLALRGTILGLIADTPALAGIVITHGTATLEESAYFLDLTLACGIPIVMVGAQRPFSALSSDAPMNLFGAVRVAADARAGGRGVLVAMNDRIHAARDVTKSSTLRLETFRSEYGPVGTIDSDQIGFFRRLDAESALSGTFSDLPASFVFPRVDIIYSYAGADEAFVEAALSRGARGIVSAGFAPGIPTRLERLALADAVEKGVAVVQCSRVLEGRVARRRYLDQAGIICGEGLNPQKARILLGLALGAGAPRDTIRDWFRRG